MTRGRQRPTTEQLWREFSNRLRRFVRSRIWSAADVDDVLQTVFLRIHSRLHELRQIDRLESWIFQITRHAVADFFRGRRDVQHEIEPQIEVADEAGTASASHELASCVRGLIARLPVDQRRALSLYELDGLSQKDVATEESLTLTAAKSRIQRGRKSLEAMLKACCEFEFDRRGNVIEYKSVDDRCCEADQQLGPSPRNSSGASGAS